MIDIKLIHQDPERFKLAARHKRIACDIDAVCALDDRRRALQQELDALKHRQNETGGQIALYKNPKSKWYQQALAEGRTEEAASNRRAAEGSGTEPSSTETVALPSWKWIFPLATAAHGLSPVVPG